LGFAASSYKINDNRYVRRSINLVFPVVLTLWFALITIDQIIGKVPFIIRIAANIAIAILICLFLECKNIRKNKVLDFSDKYSYEIYLSHHIFILGSLSTIGLTGSFPVDILIALCGTVGTSFVLHFLNSYISNRILKGNV